MKQNDWTKNCFKCGSADLKINDHIFYSKTPLKKKYLVFIYGAVCQNCHRLKYAVEGHKDKTDLSHARWWAFGQEYEDYSGRPTKWDEAMAQSISSRLLRQEQPEYSSYLDYLSKRPAPLSL